MLFKSTTGDLSNTEDCFLCSLNKNLWQKPKKIVYSSIAQSVERMTVNHDVTGSSPVGGAKQEEVTINFYGNFFLLFIYLNSTPRRYENSTFCVC